MHIFVQKFDSNVSNLEPYWSFLEFVLTREHSEPDKKIIRRAWCHSTQNEKLCINLKY